MAVSWKDADRDDLMREAEMIEMRGATAYSEFLRKHGRRPDRAQAETIGRLLGYRVRASDGTLQPAFTKAEKERRRLAKIDRDDWHRKSGHVHNIDMAIKYLMQSSDDPECIAGYINDTYASPNDSQIAAAHAWLTRLVDARRWARLGLANDNHRIRRRDW